LSKNQKEGAGAIKKHIDPKNDFAFYWLFGRAKTKHLLLDFINSVLNTNTDDLKLKNPNIIRDMQKGKDVKLDIRCVLSTGEHVNIEMQMLKYLYMPKRSAYYGSKMLIDQLKEGQKYDKLQKVITINILNHIYFKQTSKYHNKFYLTEEDTDIKLEDIIEMHFIELPKIKKTFPSKNDKLMTWLLFLKHYDDEKIMEVLRVANPKIKEAEEEFGELTADEAAKRIYEMREKAIRDKISFIDAAEGRGITKGITRRIAKRRT